MEAYVDMHDAIVRQGLRGPGDDSEFAQHSESGVL